MRIKTTTAVPIAFGIGVDAGLRSMTAPAVVAWAAHRGILDVDDSPLAFMESKWAVGLFTLAAAGEYIADLLPNVPARTSPLGLAGRIGTGALCGASVGRQSGASLAGAVAGVAGAIAGAFGGYNARTKLVRGFQVKDPWVAIPEDLVALGLGLWLMSQL